MQLKTFRKICQTIFLILFSGFFFFTIYPYPEKFPVEVFLRLDPLVALISMVAARALISTMFIAGILLVLTIVMGRFFCGYVCPLGTLIDFFDYLLFRKNHKRENKEPKPNRNIKYFVLIGVLIGSLLGADLLHFFSPMSIAPRFFTLVLFPLVIWFINFIIDLLRPLFYAAGFDGLAQVSFKKVVFVQSLVTLLLFAFIVIANHWRRRFWCRYICPAGAFLSVFSRFGILKRKVDRTVCDECYGCAMKCDMRAIGEHPADTILSECTLCGDCLPICKQHGTIGFTALGIGDYQGRLNISRRNFLYSTTAGLALSATVKTGWTAKKNVNGTFIRPPGSLPEPDFLARCIRCGECMKVCKTYGLQPAAFEAGLDGLWTPRLVSRIGGCEEKCNMCGHVCPTQAIRALPLKEKQYVKIGTAVIDRRRCIAWEQNKLCLICDEICPYDAIEFRVVTTHTGPFKRPFVLEDKCAGCGLCENKCPVAGQSAIEVYSIGEERIRKGSYITEQKKKLREVKDNQETSYDADVLGSGGEVQKEGTAPLLEKSPEEKKPVQEEAESLPGGFIVE
jgi:polyferredoxin